MFNDAYIDPNWYDRWHTWSKKYQTVSRFNERFILSLASNKRCVVIDDNLNVLPLSSHVKHVAEVPPKSAESSLTPEEEELRSVREKFQDSQPTVSKCNLGSVEITIDQK